MVKAGEQSGALVDVLRRMGDHFERFSEVQSKVQIGHDLSRCSSAASASAISIFFMTVMLPSFMTALPGHERASCR